MLFKSDWGSSRVSVLTVFDALVSPRVADVEHGVQQVVVEDLGNKNDE